MGKMQKKCMCYTAVVANVDVYGKYMDVDISMK
jgi:hypothetical protein